MIVLFGETGAASKDRERKIAQALATIQRDAGSAWFVAEPVSAAVTNAGDCPFPLASK